jgi:hypothetical protein
VPARLAPPLRDALPAFAEELSGLLERTAPALAGQVDTLRLVDRCRCGESFCSMFYTAPPPEGSYGEGHANVVLEPRKGMVILDVVAGRIVAVEVLYRPDVRDAVAAAVP